MPRRPSAKLACSKGALQALDAYVARAVLAQRECEISLKAMVRASRGGRVSGPVAAARTAYDGFFHLWAGLVWVVVEAWQSRLKCRDPRLEELLDSEFTPLLKTFRDMVFHFDPDFREAELQYAGHEDEVTVWLEKLTAELAAYFLRELGENSFVRTVVTVA